MSIKSELLKSASYLRSSKKAILGRGGEISENAGLKDVDNAISNIPFDISLAYRTDDGVSYHKIVPTNVEEYARIDSVGGMTYKSENLLPRATRTQYVANGLTFTVQDDNSIVVNGTATAETNFEILRGALGEKITIEQGKTYTLSGCPAGGSATTFRLTVQESSAYLQNYNDFGSGVTAVANYSEYYAYIRIYSGYTANNLVFKPMLNKGSTALLYSPFFEGLRDTKVTEMRSEHGNLFNFDNIYDNFKRDNNTIDVTSKAYYVDLFSGTSGGNTLFPPELRNNLIYLSKGTYYVYFDIDFYEDEVAEENKDLYARRVLPDGSHKWVPVEGTSTAKIYNGTKVVVEEDGYITLRRQFNKRCTISNLMISRTPRTEYVPYNPSVLDIPEDLRRFLEQYGYGRGVEGYPNYIDFERKVFVQNTYRKVFDGMEAFAKVGTAEWTWYLDATAKFYGASSVNILLCNHFNSKYSNTNGSVYIGGSINEKGNRIIFYDDAYSTVEEWKSHLTELYANGNPLTVEYALAEPIETDISAYLPADSFVAVEGGGTITAVNEYGHAAPSTITYLAETVGA